jgi:hypothetical protein
MKSILLSVLLFFGNTLARGEDKETVAVLELGGVPSWSLKGEGRSFGPTVAVEFTAIDNWLELEAGVTPLFSRHSREWSTDLLFKKPWTLSPKTEFMLGIGPEWIHRKEKGVITNSLGIGIAPDFMFWRSTKHRLGWYIEPTYEYDFGRGHEQSISIAVGLLIGIP